MNEVHATTTGKMIWDGYKDYKMLGTINRAGCMLTRAYGPDYPYQSFSQIPIDTDNSHSAGICKLLTLIAAHYPDVIPTNEIYAYHLLAEIHDIGELNNGGKGDIAADGTRDDEADALERKAVEKHLYNSLPKSVARFALSLYDGFQNKDTKRGQIFYLLGDKLEAILSMFVYESLGKKPNILDKVTVYHKDPDKLIDVASTEFTQNSLVPDNFLCCEFFNPDFFNYPHLSIFFEIIQSAALEVRGKEMKWLNPEIKKRTSGNHNS